MNAEQWRSKGYKTIFRNGRVYLYRPMTGITISTDVKKGDWMNYDNVNEVPWSKQDVNFMGTPLADDFITTAQNCYCDQGVGLCDFCAGIRRP